ncbi:hypothetical protein [Roseateles sp. DAIF2]|uniref:hypothetical protein n=1 Tax=Roseateles sp. DAIF2 TaxID=2714952 RepID=UPI0018A286C4|nr:hypothetical protein [Roseateles sp. DAIF2]
MEEASSVPTHLLARLAMLESRDLYLEQNEFSIVYPNKRYHGELEAGDILKAG